MPITIFEKIWARNYFIFFLCIWTVLVLLSVSWNLYQDRRSTNEKARIEARTIFQHNLAYRRWNAQHGVYVAATDEVKPNPFIVGPNRDIETKDGRLFTLISPYQMTRQTYDLLKHQSSLSAINRTVSLNPLNPENTPDDWEKTALIAFENGKSEVSEVTEINGRPYMRLLKPYITDSGCLRCHGFQGYKVGDIRGGMSISVPMEPYYELSSITERIIVLTHIVLWLIGAGTISLLSRGMKGYQEAISESERKFRIVSEFAYDLEFWVTEDKKLAFISPSCEQITGYSREAFMRRPDLLSDIIHPDDRRNYLEHLTSFDDPSHEDIEFRIITKDGQERWLSHVCSPINVGGVLIGRRGSNRDITDRKKLEDQLFHSQKMDSLGHFACGVAHDFNNLLTAVNGCVYLLREEAKQNSYPIHEYLDQILIASKLAKNMTSNLLAFGRKQISSPVKTCLNPVIRNLSGILGTLNPESIELELLLTDREVPVFVDPHQIEQLIINLCTNSKDAMPMGGKILIRTNLLILDRKYQYKFSTVPPGTYMVLSLHDTGTGMDQSVIDHIFEPFFSTKAKDRGTGLGLAIVYSIVSQSNAYIDVESVLHEGTLFRIFFPIAAGTGEGDCCLARRTGPDHAGNEHQVNVRKASILVAEDNELLRNFFSNLLGKRGYDVRVATDGEEAVRMYDEAGSPPDLLILDLILPKMNGKAAFDSIKLRHADVNALFISGYTDDIITDSCIRNEGLDFLQKPLDIEVFISKVEEMLERDTAI